MTKKNTVKPSNPPKTTRLDRPETRPPTPPGPVPFSGCFSARRDISMRPAENSSHFYLYLILFDFIFPVHETGSCGPPPRGPRRHWRAGGRLSYSAQQNWRKKERERERERERESHNNHSIIINSDKNDPRPRQI